jgi:ERCC4-related helicase
MKACYSVVGIPEMDTAHIDGEISADKRVQLWETHRLFFCTPQTFMNDLAKGVCDASKVVCIVFDEAHRASGRNYAYSQVVRRADRQPSSHRYSPRKRLFIPFMSFYHSIFFLNY